MDQTLIILHLLIIILFIFRMPLARNILGKDNVPPFLADIRFRIGLWWNTLLAPLTIMMAFFLVRVWLTSQFVHAGPAPAGYESVPVLIADSFVLAPVTEEIIQCTFLSFIAVTSTQVTITRWKRVLMNGTALAGVSLLLAAGHANFHPVSFLLCFSLFIVYGGIYYLNDRNLLPAVIAHAAWNVLSVLPLHL